MAPVVYSGSLPPKKKSELQEIASALRISDQGTKDELAIRIKKHLDTNQDALEEDPKFAGLFGRRKRSVQPQSIPYSGRFAPSTSEVEKPRSSSRRITALDPISESTPAKDLRDVSTFLKHPFSTPDSTPNQSPRQLDVMTPSRVPLPPSPKKSLVERLPKASHVKAAVQQIKQQEVFQNGNELLISLRHFLSNSRNIWSLSAVFELCYILSVVIPWKSLQVPISPKGDAGVSITINYPPWSVFQTAAFWQVILHWALPTLIIPAFVGCMISFNPANTPSESDRKHAPSAPIAPLDPLTASIIRLAAQAAYPYSLIAARADVIGLDVLGSKWRLLSASVGLAFAFAEAIAYAPQVLAKTIIREQRHAIQYDLDNNELQPTPNRRALMAEEETAEGEVD